MVYLVNEIAEMQRVSPYTVRKWCKTGRLKAYKFDGTGYRITEEAYKVFLEKCEGKAVSV